jgi:hypothetical protein
MTGTRSFFLALVLVAMPVPSLMAQSGRSPEPEIARAERALAAALEAAAEVHAGTELNAAQALLAEAHDAASRRRRSEAAALALRAELEARLAEVRAEANRLREEVRRASEDNARLRGELLGGRR